MLGSMEHVALDALNAGVAEISRSPSDVGRIELIVRRPGPGKREVLAEGVLDSAEGMIGDRWSVEAGRDPDAQLTLMNIRAAALFAGSLERCPLAGDQLFVDLDLSLENIP